MSSNGPSKHSGLAFFDLTNGSMTIPSFHMVISHVRNLHQFQAGLRAQHEMLIAIQHHIEMQEKQLDNMLAFWEPILEDLEGQSATQGESSKNN